MPDLPFELVRETLTQKRRADAPVTVKTFPAAPQPDDLAAWRACEPDRDPENLGPVYRLSDEVAVAINLALALGQPLLVTGEPGCGKTSVAYAAALQLGAPHVWRFDTRSTTTADELFYRFDHVRRFHDASALKDRDALKPADYIELQALGAALREVTTQVVLLDEVDKAPRDLPNDLLRAITEPMRFEVREVPGVARVTQRARHLVVVTSNHERDLPDAFLRRCVFVHLTFPKEDALRAIVEGHLGGGDGGLVPAAVERFVQVRARLADAQADGMARLPGTSELIAWVRALRLLGRSAAQVKEAPLDARLGVGAILKHCDELAAFAR